MTEEQASPQTPAMEAAAPAPNVLPALAATGRVAAPLEQAFVQAYRAHFSWVWRALARLGIRERDLPDVTHDVFVVVHRKLPDFDPGRPMRPWLFGICYRTALDRKRKMSHWRETPSDQLEAVAPEPAPDEVTAARQAHALVLRALQSLELDQRAVFVLHELEGMTMPDIATIIDAPLNTLYSRLRLARAAFAAAVTRLQGGAP